MTHTDLVHDVTRQLASRFQPVPLAIKKRIENLIEVRFVSKFETLLTMFSFRSGTISNAVMIGNLIITWYVCSQYQRYLR